MQDFNNDSLVLKLTYGNVRILFTGDIGRKIELKLVESGEGSTSRRLLRCRITGAKHLAVRSSSMLCVRNMQSSRWGSGIDTVFHLSGSPRTVYRERGCHILRTDQLGAIRLLN